MNHSTAHPTTVLGAALTMATSLWAAADIAPWWTPVLTTLIGTAGIVLTAKLNADWRIRQAERERDQAERERDEAVKTLRELRHRDSERQRGKG